ncbi:hypothetical protein B0H11DRAFT_2340994 [Mycena galericulata]|nr:hypothetical protein B0H11DRAFT_2340994 [Mycena galericulata]
MPLSADCSMGRFDEIKAIEENYPTTIWLSSALLPALSDRSRRFAADPHELITHLSVKSWYSERGDMLYNPIQACVHRSLYQPLRPFRGHSQNNVDARSKIVLSEFRLGIITTPLCMSSRSRAVAGKLNTLFILLTEALRVLVDNIAWVVGCGTGSCQCGSAISAFSGTHALFVHCNPHERSKLKARINANLTTITTFRLPDWGTDLMS